jgi:hypothetical protein
MTDDLAAAIDSVVESVKDDTNMSRWKSRADFVEEATKDLLRKTQREEAVKS